MATEGARAAQKMAEQKPGLQDVDGAQEKGRIDLGICYWHSFIHSFRLFL